MLNQAARSDERGGTATDERCAWRAKAFRARTVTVEMSAGEWPADLAERPRSGRDRAKRERATRCGKTFATQMGRTTTTQAAPSKAACRAGSRRHRRHHCRCRHVVGHCRREQTQQNATRRRSMMVMEVLQHLVQAGSHDGAAHAYQPKNARVAIRRFIVGPRGASYCNTIANVNRRDGTCQSSVGFGWACFSK